jgi:hypothetical protein
MIGNQPLAVIESLALQVLESVRGCLPAISPHLKQTIISKEFPDSTYCAYPLSISWRSILPFD